MSDLVKSWYSDKGNVDEMRRWEAPTLKIWEERVARRFPAGARILDVGCGMGREAFVLTDRGFSVTGVDISEEVIRQVTELSAQKGYSIPFLAYDGHTLPFASGSFDAVIIWAQTFGLLYGDAYKREFLSECGRVLTEGGLVSLSGHDERYLRAHYPNCLNGRKFYPYANTELYWETFAPDELIAHVAGAGFAEPVCEVGEIYKPEDGTVFHCLGRKQSAVISE